MLRTKKISKLTFFFKKQDFDMIEKSQLEGKLKISELEISLSEILFII